MRLFSWQRREKKRPPPDRQRPKRRPTSSFRPWMEALEDRSLPSTFTVLNNLDSGAGTLTVDGCTISANQTTFVGGGIYNAGTNAGMVTVRNSVFSGNYASGGVGGATLNIFGPFTDEGDNTFS